MSTVEMSSEVIPRDSLERRFFTVMFCDMVGSTALSETLDPEDLREILDLFRHTARRVVEQFHGHVASVQGDGLLVYFGYPVAHEDDAVLAVRAGLEILESLEATNRKAKALHGVKIRARIGIHTGLVVVDNLGAENDQLENTAVGITPNIAARIQNLAQPNEVLVSSVTWRLLKFKFNTVSLGKRELRGVKNPIQVFRVQSFNQDDGDFSQTLIGGVIDRVDREQEFDHLLKNWQTSSAGNGCSILVVGEAGIGKTRLVRELVKQLPADSYYLLDYIGSEHHQNIAFYPIIERLQRVYNIDSIDDPDQRKQLIRTLLGGGDQDMDDRLLAAFEALLTNRGYDEAAAPELDPQDVKVAIRKAMLKFIESMATKKPILLWIDDYQWIDYSSREILPSITQYLTNSPVMLLITSRPGAFLQQVSALVDETLQLERFSTKYSREFCEKLFDNRTPSTNLFNLILKRSEGVPLFLEELSASILESTWSDTQDEEISIKSLTKDQDIPTTLTGTIMARLDRLGEAKDVALTAAVQGQVFDTEVVGSICNLDNESLATSLSLLLNSGLIVKNDKEGRSYRFKHALIKEVAVQSLVKSRRRRLNLATARTIEQGKTEFTAQESDLLGHYYEQAGQFRAACLCFLRAGTESVRKSANVEAFNQLRQGLDALYKLPEDEERNQLELKFQVSMIGPGIAAFGYASPDVETVLKRALELLEQVPASPLVFPVIFSRWAVSQVLGRTQESYQIAQKAIKLSEGLSDHGARLIAHRLLGTSYILLGEPTKGIPELKQTQRLFNPEEHGHLMHICGTDPLVSANALLAFAHWLTGDAEESTRSAWTAIELAEKGGHANTIGYALTHMGVLFAVRNDLASTKNITERLLSFATSKELPFWVANARAFQGWVLANSGNIDQALEIFEQGLMFLEKAGLVYWRPTYLSWIAQAYIACADPARALDYLYQAETVIASSKEQWMESEIWRLKGIAAEMDPKLISEDAEDFFGIARRIAVKQKSLNLEIRVVTDHARSLADRGNPNKARTLLSDFLAEYPAHTSPVDVTPAKTLLAELTGPKA